MNKGPPPVAGGPIFFTIDNQYGQWFHYGGDLLFILHFRVGAPMEETMKRLTILAAMLAAFALVAAPTAASARARDNPDFGYRKDGSKSKHVSDPSKQRRPLIPASGKKVPKKK